MNRLDGIKINDQQVQKFMGSQDLIKDVNVGIAFLKELTYVQRQLRETPQKLNKGLMLIPISTEAPEWASTIEYKKLTRVGRAKVVSDYAQDFPKVGTFKQEYSVKVKTIGASYSYNQDDIMKSAQTGTPLAMLDAQTCKNAIDEEQDELIWNGNSSYNIQGFIDYPGITEYSTPNGFAGDTEWSTKTPDEIIDDMNMLVTTVISTTNGKEYPDTMLLPLVQHRLISTTRMGDGSDETILSFFLKTNGIIKNVEWVNELDGAGSGGSDRAMVYPRNSNYVRVEMPKFYREEPPQKQGLEMKIVASQKTAGVIIYFPLACAYMDNI